MTERASAAALCTWITSGKLRSRAASFRPLLTAELCAYSVIRITAQNRFFRLDAPWTLALVEDPASRARPGCGRRAQRVMAAENIASSRERIVRPFPF
jgi:hypothetical protein